MIYVLPATPSPTKDTKNDDKKYTTNALIII